MEDISTKENSPKISLPSMARLHPVLREVALRKLFGYRYQLMPRCMGYGYSGISLARQTQGFGRGHGVAQVLEDSLQPMHAPSWQETVSHDGQHLCWHQVDTYDPEIKNHSKKMKNPPHFQTTEVWRL